MKPKFRLFYYLLLGAEKMDPEVYSFYWVACKWFEKANGKPSMTDQELLNFVYEWVINDR
jgi:hypothetical protein